MRTPPRRLRFEDSTLSIHVPVTARMQTHNAQHGIDGRAKVCGCAGGLGDGSQPRILRLPFLVKDPAQRSADTAARSMLSSEDLGELPLRDA